MEVTRQDTSGGVCVCVSLPEDRLRGGLVSRGERTVRGSLSARTGEAREGWRSAQRGTGSGPDKRAVNQPWGKEVFGVEMDGWMTGERERERGEGGVEEKERNGMSRDDEQQVSPVNKKGRGRREGKEGKGKKGRGALSKRRVKRRETSSVQTLQGKRAK